MTAKTRLTNPRKLDTITALPGPTAPQALPHETQTATTTSAASVVSGRSARPPRSELPTGSPQAPTGKPTVTEGAARVVG